MIAGDSTSRVFSTRTRSASTSIPMKSLDCSEYEPKTERFPSIYKTENNDWPADDYVRKNEHLLSSGQLGICNDPYCTTCPTYYNVKGRQKYSRASEILDTKFPNMLYGDAKGWAKRICSFMHPYILGVMNPHAKVVQQWNKFFVISCLFAGFLDPLFFFLLCVQQDNKCIVLNWPMKTTIVVLRSINDFIYLIHILVQFRLAYVSLESRVMGAGDLVDDPKRIAWNYLSGYFIIDFFVVLPLPQIIILLILPDSVGASGANHAKNRLRAAILVQYIPRLYRFLTLVAGSSPTGFTFEVDRANFVINFLTYFLVSHVIGSFWYLFGLQVGFLSLKVLFIWFLRTVDVFILLVFLYLKNPLHGGSMNAFEMPVKTAKSKGVWSSLTAAMETVMRGLDTIQHGSSGKTMKMQLLVFGKVDLTLEYIKLQPT